MSRFIENEALPIVSTLLRQGFLPDYSEALTIIDQSELRTSGDAKWALGATGLGVASSCGILALSGVTLPIIIPIGAALGCLMTAWNSRQTEIDRIKESEFLGQFPQVLALIESKDAAGATEAHIAAAYEQTFKAYRYGDLDSIDRFLKPETQAPPQNTPPELTVPPVEHPVTPVPHTVQQTPIAQVEHPTSPQIVPVEQHRFIDTLMENPYQSRAIIAGQRTGKTYGAAVATWCLAQDGTEVFYVNLFDHGQGNCEAFGHARSVIGDLDKLSDDAGADLVADAVSLIHQFRQSSDAILVVDEWMILGSENRDTAGMDRFWKILGDETSRLCSNGIGNGRAIWGIAPFYKAGQLRKDAKLLKECVPMVLSITPGHAVAWANPRSGKVTQVKGQPQIIGDVLTNWPGCGISAPSDDQSRQWRREGVERVYWNQGHWHPMGSCPTLPAAKPSPPVAVVTTPRPSPVDAALPDLYQAIAHMAVAKARTETPGTINADGSKSPIELGGDDGLKSELVRYLSAATEPKKVSQIRTSIKPPYRGIGSDKLRLVLAELVATNQIQAVGARFTAST
jgi:hypothetical protein